MFGAVAAGRDFCHEDVAAVNIAMDESAFETVQVIESQCRLLHYFLTSQSLQDGSHLIVIGRYQILH